MIRVEFRRLIDENKLSSSYMTCHQKEGLDYRILCQHIEHQYWSIKSNEHHTCLIEAWFSRGDVVPDSRSW